MNLLRTFRVEKSLKVETTTKKIDLKGETVLINTGEGTYSSYFEVLPLNTNLPYLVDKTKVFKMIESGGLVEDLESTPSKTLNPNSNGLPITHDNLLNAGFVVRANMYIKDKASVQLIKGHTWVLSRANEKFNKDVRYMEDLV